MSHFREYQSGESTDGRNLGDEWLDWDGRSNQQTMSGRGLFLTIGAIFLLAFDLFIYFVVYLITPRLAMWNDLLPMIAWIVMVVFILFSVAWFTCLAATVITGKNRMLFGSILPAMFGLLFSGSFRVASWFKFSRDRIGHSFVRVYNSISRATKVKKDEEKLLILLPRCLTKELLKEITGLKDIYPVDVHTVSGGELARKKVKELRPTAVIGVACERDLVSGIRDVGNRFSVIGIPNLRPDGPCKNTTIDMRELISAIEFYVGPPVVKVVAEDVSSGE